MKLLQRLLKAQAWLWALWGLISLAAPGWLTAAVFGQQGESGSDVWVRLAGVMALTLALLMVLVSQRLVDVWWWSWAFALLDLGVATVVALHALLGLPEGASPLPWIAVAAVLGGLGAGLLVGLVGSEQEKPFV